MPDPKMAPYSYWPLAPLISNPVVMISSKKRTPKGERRGDNTDPHTSDADGETKSGGN
jgi:hypothetical protein